MREILFKAKRKDNNEWAEGCIWTMLDNSDGPITKKYFIRDKNYSVYGSYSWKDYEIIPETVSQYTGLTDKNGAKIFENDIVRLDDEYRKLISSVNAKTEEDLVRKDCLVGFKDGSFMFCRNRYVIDDFDSYLWLSNEHCEVIGNIFNEEVK